MNMNIKLKTLYEKHWEALENASKGIGAAHPLLIKVRDEYEQSDIKIMICGQETDGWNGEFGNIDSKDKDIDFLMDDYEAYFYNDKDYKHHYKGRLKRKNKRSFWNRKNFKYFQENLKDFEDKKIAFIWNNLSKIGNSTNRGKATKEVQKLEEKHFKLFDEELKILCPDIIIFRTGKRAIPNSSLKPISKEKPVQIIELKVFSKIFAVKTYHPRSALKGLKKEVLEIIKDNL